MGNSKKGKVCVIRLQYFPTDPRVYKEVRALSSAGYSADVVCLRGSGQSVTEVIDGVRVYRLPILMRRGSKIKYLFAYGLSLPLIAVIVTILHCVRRYDLLQVNTMPDALVFTTALPRLFGAKVLLDMHEPIPELWITKYGEKRFSILLKLLIFIERWSIKYAHRVITVNETIRERFIERGANGRKIAVVRNVPGEEILKNINSFSLPREFTLITHGTIVERYGHEIIIRALLLLKKEISRLKLYIVGDGDDKQKIVSLCNQLGCSDLVTITGIVPLSQVYQYILSSTVGLVPILMSPFADLCQPNKLFEYVALKRPVIASRLKAIEESFDDSCILFSEPGNPEDLARCILELYKNPDKGKMLSENAYKQYEKLRWSKAKEIYLEIVQELVK
jgi:glycosyltransferase involved in cell wall biosynthesis